MMTGTGGDTRMNKPSRSVSQPWRRRWPYVSRDQIHPGGSGRAALKIRTKPSKSSLSLPLPKPPPPRRMPWGCLCRKGEKGERPIHARMHACRVDGEGSRENLISVSLYSRSLPPLYRLRFPLLSLSPSSVSPPSL